MKAILLFALLTLAFCAEYAKEDNVIILTDDNFDEAIKEFPHVLVKFYAPWCGHCKKLAPEYSKAAEVLAKENIILAQVDATVQKKLGERFEIKGYPSLKFFNKGSDIEYNGGRTESEIIAWMRKKTGPAVKIIASAEELTKFKEDNKVVLVYFGAEKAELEEFERIALNYEDIQFGSVADEELKKANAATKKIVLFKHFDEKQNDFEGEITKADVTAFITKHSTPLIMAFDEACAQTIFGKNIPGLFLYRDKTSEKAEEFNKMMTEVAEKVKGKLQVVVTGIADGFEQRLAEYIGVTAADLPTVRIHDTKVDLKKYNMAGDITVENIIAFVNDWENGKLTPHLKSQEIPAEQEGPVYKIVGKSFKDVVVNNDKDVLVKFYAPWCGHCKKLAPIYEELAKKYKDNDKLVIADIDSTENEVEEVQISGFPTLKFWAGGKKSAPIDFTGDRTLEGFEKFLKEKMTNPFEIIETKKEEEEKEPEKKEPEKKDDL